MSDASSTGIGDPTTATSEPDPSQLPDISWCGSPDSTLTFASTPSGRGSKKRTQTATETWAHAKKLKLDEQVRRDRAGNKIWVCGKCAWESASLTSARNHLDLRHGVKIKAQQGLVAQKGQAKLEQIFQRQGQKRMNGRGTEFSATQTILADEADEITDVLDAIDLESETRKIIVKENERMIT
ncbi:hypothetical protein PWT90_10984 [Aphanocladium album]|nr:hypothetical protein PWT90_10984 [Aphanocladium album]